MDVASPDWPTLQSDNDDEQDHDKNEDFHDVTVNLPRDFNLL